jgi:hypothetical protein
MTITAHHDINLYRCFARHLDGSDFTTWFENDGKRNNSGPVMTRGIKQITFTNTSFAHCLLLLNPVLTWLSKAFSD